MDAQSQITKHGQYSRACNSCRRNLNLCHFGTLRVGRDGFNSTCKVCRQQAQKKHFAKTYRRKRPLRAKASPFIASLDQHNGMVLTKLLPSDTKIELVGVTVTNGSPCRVQVEVIGRGSRRCLRFQLLVADDDRPFTVESGTFDIESFVRCCLLILREQSVRLFEPGIPSRAETLFLNDTLPKPGPKPTR